MPFQCSRPSASISHSTHSKHSVPSCPQIRPSRCQLKANPLQTMPNVPRSAVHSRTSSSPTTLRPKPMNQIQRRYNTSSNRTHHPRNPISNPTSPAPPRPTPNSKKRTAPIPHQPWPPLLHKSNPRHMNLLLPPNHLPRLFLRLARLGCDIEVL